MNKSNFGRTTRFIIFAFALIIFSTTTSSIFAAPVNLTEIQGKVRTTDKDKERVAGVQITARCTHNGSVNTQTTTTDSSGKYTMFFTLDECNIGDTVTLAATKNDMSGSGTAVIKGRDEPHKTKMDINITNIAVPEYGTITLAITAIGALGLFYMNRKSFISA